MINVDCSVLDRGEQITLALRALYVQHGFRRYRMSKFEEYDLYSKNKDFLISDRVITFTDTDGKLMALKPDVTLSIVKNHRDNTETLEKLCYNENVYRVSGGNGTFREVEQSGLECIGKVDEACLGEVMLLAAQSLNLFGKPFVLEVSHLDILSQMIGAVSDDSALRAALLKCAGAKNRHGIEALCAGKDIPAEKSAPLLALLNLHGTPEKVLPELRRLCETPALKDCFVALCKSLMGVCGTYSHSVNIDFSLTADPNYYNGIVFNGFVDGVASSVLSGGQYDRLMTRMGRKSTAVGFAVYTDLLEGATND